VTVCPALTPKEGQALKKNILFSLCLVLAAVASSAAQESQPTTAGQPTTQTKAGNDADIQLLREDVRNDRKKIVAANLPLTAAEAAKFWPVYDQYVNDMKTVNDARISIIKQYAENYETMTDAQAQDLITRWLSADSDSIQLRKQYVPQFQKVIPAKKVATFFQIDHRIDLILNLQLASQLPLVTP